MRIEEYIPEQFDDHHVKVLVELRPCAVCKRKTVWNLGKDPWQRTFPCYIRATFERQIAKTDIRFVGGTNGDREPVCIDCVKAGAITCECALCGKSKPSSEMEESVGDPPEHLCKSCYETVPAKIWDENLAALEESHKYDFE